MDADETSVTELLLNMREGSWETLLPLVYDELRRLASYQLRDERQEHTLQPTALVHEAFLRLVDQERATPASRAQFFALAGHVMRRVLVDHARRRNADKRGGGQLLRLTSDIDAPQPDIDADIVRVDEALKRLSQLDERQARIVELRYFAGLTAEETAGALNLSLSTVKRDWTVARAWLQRELSS